MSRTSLIGLCLVALSIAACSSDDSSSASSDAAAATLTESTAEANGVRVVSPEEGADIQANPPEGLVILDVRTPEEFDEGHLEGAIMLDFYEPDFADRLAELDSDVPYLLYCRSGNRSGQARDMMADLGFTDVADIDGGIVTWVDAGYPVTDL